MGLDGEKTRRINTPETSPLHTELCHVGNARRALGSGLSQASEWPVGGHQCASLPQG